MSKKTDRYREQIADEVLEIAHNLGMDGSDFLNVDGLSYGSDYAPSMIAEDTGMLAQRTRVLQANMEALAGEVGRMADKLGLEAEVPLYARDLDPRSYVIEHALEDMGTLVEQACVVGHDRESLRAELGASLNAVVVYSVLTGVTPREDNQ